MSACFRHAFWNRTTRDAKERGPLTRINTGLRRDDLIILRQRAPCARKQGEQLISDARNRNPRRPLVLCLGAAFLPATKSILRGCCSPAARSPAVILPRFRSH